MTKSNWVDFGEVKRAVSFDQVLAHYQINWLREEGDNLRGKCPLHEGEGQRAFHVSLEKNAFYCFSCKAKGNVLDFVSLRENCSIREAALKLQDWFLSGSNGQSRPTAKERAKPEKPEASEAKAQEVNPTLGFELRVDTGHEYGKKRGLSQETLTLFGAGLCRSKGMFAGRFVIPLSDPSGNLVGYAGRSLDDEEPKYLFPSKERGFYKRHLLFNFHRLEKEADEPVVVVEGFFDCMKVQEAGFPCVALMGSTLTEEQETLLADRFERVILLLDGDEAGRLATEDCLRRLSRKLFVKAIDLADGEQPDNLSEERLRVLLG